MAAGGYARYKSPPFEFPYLYPQQHGGGETHQYKRGVAKQLQDDFDSVHDDLFLSIDKTIFDRIAIFMYDCNIVIMTLLPQ